MANGEHDFTRELEIFRTECEAAAQYFYGYLAIHELARRDKQVFNVLNRNAFFWNTVLSGLQTSAVITLGRIFDQDRQSHSLDRLVSIARSNVAIFSRSALASRRPSIGAATLDPCAYEPDQGDFKRLKRRIAKHRRMYEKNVRGIRHKMLAHKVLVEQTEIDALLSGTRIGEIQQVLVFLISLHESLDGLFRNGLKPTVRRRRYSVARLRRLPALAGRSFDVHEQMVGQAALVLLSIARPNKRMEPTRRSSRVIMSQRRAAHS